MKESEQNTSIIKGAISMSRTAKIDIDLKTYFLKQVEHHYFLITSCIKRITS